MDAHGWIAVMTLVAATALFITKKLPIAVTALLIPIVLFATRVLPDPQDALVGFGNKAALAIAAVMVIGAGLKECGVATLMARGLQRVGGRSEVGVVLAVMIATAVLSTVMSNAAVVAILLPVCMALSRRTGVAASRMLMPLAYAAMLGGTVTLIGTAPNFLVDDYLRHPQPDDPLRAAKLAEEFQVFDFAGAGLAITAAGIAFMILIGRRMLPVVRDEERFTRAQLPEEVASRFQLQGQLFMFKLAPESPLVGRSIAASDIRARYGIGIVMVRRGAALAEKWLQPDPELVLAEGDRLYGEGTDEAAWSLAEEELAQLGLAGSEAVERILGHGTTLAEIALPPRSNALGRTFHDLHFRKRFGLNVLMLWRYGEPVGGDASDRRLSVGDTFLATGPAERVRALSGHPDYIVLSDHSQAEDVTRAPLAIGLLLLAVLPPILTPAVPLPVSALAAALLMLTTGCLSQQALVRAIDWNVICLIVGTVPLGIALKDHGVAAVAADAVNAVGGALGPPGVIAILFLLAAVLATLTSNAAAAVIMAPVAVLAAGPADLAFTSVLLAVAYGASCAFLLPFAQCNILVYAPGGYTTRDFIKVGLWMSLLMWGVTVLVLSL
ncbi:MAG: SLC13 family permease [Planctomycetota bacterium]|nr:SLC13 family permease [Planctomycetota bacterium]